MPHRPTHSELLAQLTAGIEALTASDAWHAYLEAQSRFHRYSFGNTLLIVSQRPDATQVAGFSTWRRLGRQVARGEKALYVLAPIRARRRGDDEEEEEAEPAVKGFRFVPVFDIAQTDGDPLPSVCTRLEDGPVPAGPAYRRLAAYAAEIGFVVEDHRFGGASNGDCSHSLRRIRVEADNGSHQRLKTLAHELAHALLHEHPPSRALAELEAESVAYVVCRRLGIDTGAYSFGYLATWAGGGDAAVAAIRASCTRIQQAAGRVLSHVEVPEAAGSRVGAGRSADAPGHRP